MLRLSEQIALTAARALATLGLCLLLTLAAMTLADGLARWLLNQPIEGVRDVGALVVAVAIACCLPSGLAERGNITIRLLEGVHPRISKLLDVVASALVLVIMGLLAWQVWVHAAIVARDAEATWILKLPTAPFWYAVALVLWCAVFVQATVVGLEVHRLVTPAPRAPS